MEKSREQKMTEFYKRKVMRLEEKNDKLKFQISQIKDEKSDDILMRLYESEYGDKSEKRIIKGEDFLDNEVFIDDLISSVYYEKVRDFFVDYVMSNNPLPFNPMKLLKDMFKNIIAGIFYLFFKDLMYLAKFSLSLWILAWRGEPRWKINGGFPGKCLR